MARFSVVIAGDYRYTHKAAFNEVAESILYGLRRLGHDAEAGADHDAGPERRQIILGPHLLDVDPPEGAILYNLEQVDSASPWFTPRTIDRFRRYTVWDYSAANARGLRERYGVEAGVVPIGYVPELSRIQQRREKPIDVLFFGSVNGRRYDVLNALRSHKLHVESLFNVYGQRRDEYIAKAKIILNVHFYAASVFEVVRVSYLLANHCCVVSEGPVERGFEDALAWAPYEDLHTRCIGLLSPGLAVARDAYATHGYFAMKSRPMEEILERALAP